MSGPTQPNRQADALRLQIEQIRRARTLLKRSVDASGMTLSRGVAASRPDVAYERRLRSAKGQFPLYLRFLGVSLLSVAVVMAAIYQLNSAPAPDLRPNRAEERTIPSNPAASNAATTAIASVTTDYTLVIHIHAKRACRVRMVVDETPLEWRALRPGDELLSRPRQQLLLETDDGGALSATVNGAPIALASDGQPIAVRLTTERPYPEPVLVP